MGKNRLRESFRHAFKGIGILVKEEKNFRLQLIIASAVLFLMLIFNLSVTERGILILVIMIVLLLEMLNSILERILDIFKPRVHTYIRDMKDMTAAAVLVASIGATLVGFIIFCPHFKELIFKLI